jgi:structural maintenance of chromosome 4
MMDAPVPPADESEDDFAPAAPASPRRTRRKPVDAPTTPKKRLGRPKKSIAPSEASEVLDPEQSTIIAEQEEPVKKASPRKRKSVAPRASKAATPDLAPPLLTPKASASPAASQLEATPLGDITASIINEQPKAVDETLLAATKPIKAMDTILEKPMDIVLKSRNMTVPIVENTGPKARIVITYLILTNFKSYAGRQEVGPFHASFSSVVGPNGSGKSNVIDSLLFVFGFRASKMRQGKISALIHNSAQYPDLDHCEVAVHFQEVMDMVRFGRCPCVALMIANRNLSPAVLPKSYPIRTLSFPGEPSRTIRARTTSTARVPTSPR